MQSLQSFKTVDERRKYISELTGKNLDGISYLGNSGDDVVGIKIENLVGAVPVPMGVAGPLPIARTHHQENTENRTKDYWIPLATTESALVASVHRGCKAIRLAGGAHTHSEKKGASRSPVFKVKSLAHAVELSQWITNHTAELSSKAQETSRHISLIDASVTHTSEYVFARFSFDTDNAMGMNMATIATDLISKYIEENTSAQCITIAGNYDIDKKPAWLNVIKQRGIAVWAEAIISEEIIKKVLKTTAQDIFEVWLAKCVYGSALSGSLGFNAQFANIISAMYIATGQDPAHVVEGSLGITSTKVINNKDLLISVYLPAVMVGIVGGGTRYKAQKTALDIISPESTQEFAEVIAGAVLAGELSLLSAQAEGALAKAHKSLR